MSNFSSLFHAFCPGLSENQKKKIAQGVAMHEVRHFEIVE